MIRHSPTWSQKIDRFKITDPVLRYLASKYESEIPWQKAVKNEPELRRFVRRTLLPNYLERLQYNRNEPSSNADSRYFLDPKKIDLTRILSNPELFHEAERREIGEIRNQQGEDAARSYATDSLNIRKHESYQVWVRKLANYWYRSDHAFVYLMIRGMMDSLGKKSIRTLNEPEKIYIKWLRRRLQTQCFDPMVNIPEAYRSQFGYWSGTSSIDSQIQFTGDRANGWGYFPQNSDTSVLSNACSGSGWCIAGSYMARTYLNSGCFYILFSNKKPVVALRVEGKTVVECQGRCNRYPDGYESDISLFCQTLSLKLNHYRAPIEKAAKDEQITMGDSAEWWRQRAARWPFALITSPKTIVDLLSEEYSASTCVYEKFPAYAELSQQLAPSASPAKLCGIIRKRPFIYNQLSKFDIYEEHLTSFQSAAIQGWKELLEWDMIPDERIHLIPNFAFESPEFVKHFEAHFPSALRQKVRVLKVNRKEREKPFTLSQALPSFVDESPLIAREKMVNLLLNDQEGILNDFIFPESVRDRTDFDQLRREAWSEAFDAAPPLWFALPPEYLKDRSFRIQSGRFRGRANASKWLSQVKERPWYLLHQDCPKLLRRHLRFLNAYRDAWITHFKNDPSRLWYEFGKHKSLMGSYPNRRVYASYALLHDEKVIDALTEGWLNSLSAWDRASKRMQRIPGIRLSMLCALSSIFKSGELDNSEHESAASVLSGIRQLEPTNPNSHLHPRICELMEELSNY